MNYFNRLLRILPFIVLIFITLFFFRDIFFQNQIIASDISLKYAPLSLSNDAKGYDFDSELRSDMLDGYYPIAKNISEQIKKDGKLPIWDNSIKFGAPVNILIIGIPMLNYLAAFISLPTLTTFFVIFKFLLSIIFSYALAKKLGFTKLASTYTSIAYTLSGFNIVWIWGSATTISLLLPMLVYGVLLTFTQKKLLHGFIITYWAVFLMIWSGFISGFAFALYFLIPIYTFLGIRKILKSKTILKSNYFILPIILAISTFSILFLLLPSLSYLNHIDISYREEINAKAHLDKKSHLIQLFIPLYNGGESLNDLDFAYSASINYNETSGYIGIIGYFFFFMGLIFLIRERLKSKFISYLFLVWIFTIFIIYGIGPLNSLVSNLPLLSSSSSTRLLMLNAFAASFISGFGLSSIINKKDSLKLAALTNKKKKNLFLILNTLLISGLLLFIYVYRLTLENDTYANATRIEFFKLSMLLIAVIVFIYLSIITSLSLLIGKGKIYFGYIVILLISFELLFYATGQLPTIEKDYFYPISEGTQYLTDKVNESDRILVLGAVYGSRGTELFYEFNTPFPHTLYTQSEKDLMEDLFKDDSKIFASKTLPFNHPDNINYDSPILDLINVKYLVFHPLQQFSDEDSKMLNDNFKLVYKNDTDLMIYENIGGNSIVHSTKPNAKFESKILEFTDTYQKISIDASEKTTIYLSLANYPGWSAKVNGEEATIETIDSLWKGVEISNGPSEIEFIYKENSTLSLLKYISLVIISLSGILTLLYVTLRIYVIRNSFIPKGR